MDGERETLKEKIYKYISMIKADEKVNHALKRLNEMHITLELLTETGVGKVVNRLRSDEKYGSKAMKIVEKWKGVAKNGQMIVVKSIKEEPMDMDKFERPAKYPSPSLDIKPEINGKRDIKVELNLDPFAAQLAAADKVSSKPKKAKYSSTQLVDDIERSLISERARSSVPSNYFPSSLGSSFVATPESANFAESGMFKPRKGMNKVYAGKKKATVNTGSVPRLFDICIRVCANNIDAIEETGDIPFDILRPILEKCSHSQLARIECKNKYLVEDGDYLWERHCKKVFPTKAGSDIDYDEDDSWKERFERLANERDQKLVAIQDRIKQQKVEQLPIRKAMLSDPIAPKFARRRQIKNGLVCSASSVPSAAELSRSRRQIFETGSKHDLQQLPKALRNTSSQLGGSKSSSFSKPKPAKGALMMKTLRMMKGRK